MIFREEEMKMQNFKPIAVFSLQYLLHTDPYGPKLHSLGLSCSILSRPLLCHILLIWFRWSFSSVLAGLGPVYWGNTFVFSFWCLLPCAFSQISLFWLSTRTAPAAFRAQNKVDQAQEYTHLSTVMKAGSFPCNIEHLCVATGYWGQSDCFQWWHR